jgi:hypothetical protein
MPWKASSVMEERLRFVARLLDGEAMTDVCRAALGRGKIRELLVRRLGGDVRVPAKSTIHAVLDRHGLAWRRAAPPRARHAAVRGRHAQ